MSADMESCEQTLNSINEKVTDLVENVPDLLQHLIDGQVTIQKNQVAIAEAVKKVNKNILLNIDISVEQSKYLKDIRDSRGALPDQVLDQLETIEAVSKELNKTILGGTD